MSRVDALLASFKQGQKAALRTQAEARQEREDKLAKAHGGQQGGRGGRGGKATAGRGARKATSAASGDASAASGAAGGSDWKQRRRQGQPILPMGVKIKAVVDFLRASADPQQASAIAGATSFNPATDPALAAALATNNKVLLQEDGLYAYNPEVANVRSKQEVLEYMQRRVREGEGYAALGELQDAYPGVRQDLEALKREGLLLGLPAADSSRREVFYPVDRRLQLAVDSDVQELWLTVGGQLPEEEEEVAAELAKIGMKPAPRRAVERREARERKKKARKVRRLTRVTNVHLAHLLEGEGPAHIETA